MSTHSINKVAIIGAGTMGGGIAISTISAGIDTVLIDASEASLARATGRADKFFGRNVSKGRMAVAEAEALKAKLSLSTSYADAAGADLVIEAVFEDLSVKDKVMAELEPLVADDCIIVTNTSSLRVGEVAASLSVPGRFLGLHYFNPPEVNPVVEVVKGAQTDAAAVAAVSAFLERTGKIAIVCLDQSGFAINRFFVPYANEAARCVEDDLGTTAQVDEVCRALFDLPMGPFATMNMVGLPIMLHALENLRPLGPYYAPAQNLAELGAADGCWDIDEEPQPLAAAAEARIQLRMKGSVFFTVGELLAEGVASAEDVDLGASKALRFGNPPVAMMRAEGEAARKDALASL